MPFAYLFGFLALLVPLALHLWTRQQAPLIRIGSTKWLKNTPISRSEQSLQGLQNFWLFRFSERRLWFLRTAILAIVVLLVAEVIGEMPFFEQKKKNWLLISPSVSENPQVRPILDSCRKLDYQIKFFSENFPTYNSQKPENQADSTNYFELLQKLYAQKQDFDSAWVLLDPFQKKFRQAKQTWAVSQADSLKIRISPVTDDQKIKTNLVKAYFAEPAQLHLVWFLSEQQRNQFIISRLEEKMENKLLQNNLPAAVEIFEKSGQWWAKMLGGKDVLVEKKQTKKIGIKYDTDRQEEILYLRKALESVEIFAEQPLEIQVLEGDPQNWEKTKMDFLIWFSDQKMPFQASNSLKILEGKKGNLISEKSLILEEKEKKGLLFKRIGSTEKGKPVWETPENEPIMLETSPYHFVFYSRFRQDWGNFDELLPYFFLRLLVGNSISPNPEYDQIEIDTWQLRPLLKESQEEKTELEKKPKNPFFEQFLMVLLLGFLILERIMSKNNDRSA